jgi:uncharacterized protein YcbK (DUF882 family)
VTGHLIPPDRRDERWSLGQVAFFGVAAMVAVGVLIAFPPNRLLGSVFGEAPDAPTKFVPSAEAFGKSGEVRMQVKLPGEPYDFPLEIVPPVGATYQWVRAVDSGAVSLDTALVGTTVRSPAKAGLYHLAINSGGKRHVLGEIVVAVLIPFSEKLGGSVQGYRIGTYTWERARGDATPPPPGFIEVWAEDAPIWVTSHLQLTDFLTHDSQKERWPKYVALDRRILDKVELVLGHLGSRDRELNVRVSSGFRTPLHNRRVPRAASDSRHQYGDAIDLSLDADGDGRVSYFDILAVARAVDRVEADHPELVRGLGVYGNRGNSPYVHIDVRGERKRWRG